MAQIDLVNVSFAYPGQAPVIRDVTASVDRGQALALVGPNGGGKSTLLRLIMGALAPASGYVQVDGRRVWPSGAALRRALARIVAWVPSGVSLPFDYTVRDIVLMGRIPHLARWGFESAADVAIAEGVMRELDVVHLATRAFSACSAGEQQRVLLAKALAQAPQVLLLDEATTHLDMRHALDLVERLRSLHARGLTLLFATHDLNVAATLCDAAWLVHGGHIVAAGPLPDVFVPDVLEPVYGVHVEVLRSPLTGYMRVHPHAPMVKAAT